MGNLSSINIKPVKANSQNHNERLGDLDYVYSELTKNNETWKSPENGEISSRLVAISELYKEKVGQKMQAKSTPIREAVVNMREDHTMEDLKRLAADLREEFKIEAFQIHIHRDEGHTKKYKSKGEKKGDIVLNRHAHILFDWQNKSTGKSIKLNKYNISKMQDITASSLGMERGDLKENSNTERLEAVAFKEKKIAEEIKEMIPKVVLLKKEEFRLQEETKDLEQKKNEAERKYFSLAREDFGAPGKEELSEAEFDSENIENASIEEIQRALEFQSSEIERLENECREMEEKSQRIAESNANWWRNQRKEKDFISGIEREEESIRITKQAIEDLERQINELKNQSE